MGRFLLAAAAALFAFPAVAFDTHSRLLLLQTIDRPVLDLDFTRMTTLDPRITFSRASNSTGLNCASPQLVVTLSTDVPVLGVCDNNGRSLGWSNWTASTIQNKWSRDLTQSGTWVKVNTTAALNQTGVDGAANSATLVSASGANGTILQPLPAGAINRILSADVKRVVGNGPVSMTMDGGATWSLITASINSLTYTRVPPDGMAQTVLNPSFGFKLDVSGDAIAVDYVQLESDVNSSLVAPTPRVLTTNGGNIVRASDVASINLSSIPGLNLDDFTVVYKVVTPKWFGAVPQGSNKGVIQFDNGTDGESLTSYMQANAPIDLNNNDYVWLGRHGGNIVTSKVRCASTEGQIGFLTPVVAGSFGTVSVGYNINTGIGISCNNGAGSGNMIEVFFTPIGLASHALTRLLIGATGNNSTPMNGYIQRLQIYNGRRRGGALTSIQAALQPGTPYLSPVYLQLDAGGFILYETGSNIQCNKC